MQKIFASLAIATAFISLPLSAQQTLPAIPSVVQESLTVKSDDTVGIVCLKAGSKELGSNAWAAGAMIGQAARAALKFVGGSVVESTAILADKAGYKEVAANILDQNKDHVNLYFTDFNIAMLAQYSSQARANIANGAASAAAKAQILETYKALGLAAKDISAKGLAVAQDSASNVIGIYANGNQSSMAEIAKACHDAGFLVSTLVGFRLVKWAGEYMFGASAAKAVRPTRIDPELDLTRRDSFIDEMLKREDAKKPLVAPTIEKLPKGETQVMSSDGLLVHPLNPETTK